MYFRYVQCSGEHVYKDRFKVIDLVLTGLSEVEKSHRWSWCVQKQHWSTSPITLFCFSCSKFFSFFFFGEKTFEMGEGEMGRHYVQELLYQFLDHSVVLMHTTNSTYIYLKFFTWIKSPTTPIPFRYVGTNEISIYF